ncbi:acetate/propionate family kinase [Microvirga flavescens]|uniref:acetate/propionate family kinase n=1 Tax=Microvirga flavescens TaxID=2249811 RepID=UPI000DD7EBAD|nr:acetate/propionate family kinase [Microvirga flavescens]
MSSVFVVLNGGSSSLKFQIFDPAGSPDPKIIYRGMVEGIGTSPHFIVKDCDGTVVADMTWEGRMPFGHEEALVELVGWMQAHRGGYKLGAVGHRIVHGGRFFDGPVLVDETVLEKLETLKPLAPLHQPHNLEPIHILSRRAPDIPQVACFDTAFHRNQPEIAQLFAIPHEMTEAGVLRYGFHGLSYSYISSVLADYDSRLKTGRVVVAHLGNGASVCALKNGKSIATSMGFSAIDGLPMGTRCGALDVGVVFYMLRDMKLNADEVEKILYTKSGLLGVSGLSSDMRTLRSQASSNRNAQRAIDLFVYRVTREIGSLIAALGGIDGIVFTAGIGENDAATRAAILEDLTWAGFTLDDTANSSHATRITTGSAPGAWIIPTNEELVVARQMSQVLSATARRLAS